MTAAISPCPNDVFIFAGLISGATARPGWEFEFQFHELETLNRGAQSARWDLAKISYANYRRCASGYGLLDCGGALGRGCGPLLLSNGRPWDPAAEVLVPGEFTTANFLLDFFVSAEGASRPARKTYLPFDELYRRLLGPEPCQGVVIHEMRFTYASDGLNLIRDLGACWEEKTRHPIPLGAVAVRNSLESEIPGTAGILQELIRASLLWSRKHPLEALALCRQHSQSMSDAVLKAHINLYVNDFSLDLGPDGKEAVAYFLECQAAFPGASDSAA